jgi:type III secretion protein U
LRKARTQGDSGASAAAAHGAAFVAAAAVAPALLAALASRSAADLERTIASLGGLEEKGALRFDPFLFAGGVLALLVPGLLAVGLAGAAAQLVQTGGVVSFERIAPRLDRLDPASGLRALFSRTRLFAVLRAFAAATFVAWLAWMGLSHRVVDIARTAGRLRWTGVVVADVAGRLAWQAAAALAVLGVADAFVTRAAWTRRLRMSKEEVRQEHRESEGDPALRAARRRAHQEVLVQATLADVRTASVVVVNPTHLACALRYQAGGDDPDDAPVVVASGEGDLAARIVQMAHEAGVPVVRDVPLARALVELAVGDAIPEALYEAVAEILRELSQGG